ncbi:MAG: SCP2 sterol-binding domain-containing protein [Dermatophilaceae bacterium]
MALDPQTLPGLTAAEFVATVSRASQRELRADLGGPHREALLDLVFARFPGQFRPEQAGSRSARIDFRITGGPSGSSDTYAVVVDGGACSIDKHPTGEPDLSLTLGPAEFLGLIVGTGNPVTMFLTGKVRARGDLALAGALRTWFAGPNT